MGKELKGFEVYTFGKTTSAVDMENQGEFFIGHVGRQQVYVSNTPEQISAFIMKHQFENVMLTNILDVRVLETSTGFLQFCADQQYLASTLLPVLVPMQRGEVEAIEFIPHSIATEADCIIDGIRMKSGAGHYLGTLIFDEGYPQQYSRETDYYQTEKSVENDFPESISWDDAIEQARQKGWIK